MKNLWGLVWIAIVAVVLTGCLPGDQAMQQQSEQTREMTAEAQAQLGMPGITNFTERRVLRQLFELRDQELATYTYIVDFQGRLWHVCDSIGYGLPFSAQFSNPTAPVRLKLPGASGSGVFVLPQPEPNGMYPPTSSSATWVICADPAGEFVPLYVEPTITVSPFKLNAVGSYAAVAVPAAD